MAVHFHSYPILSRASQEKVRELARVLTRYQQYMKIYMVPFGEIQQQVMLAVAPPLRVVIYRRLMVRIAQALAEQCDAHALVTGEVIGQVASQTLENMTSIGSVATMPVFRPLIGMDKDEITIEAQKLGTYPISIIEDQDCCQLFTPKHPATKARARDVEMAERNLPIDTFVQSAVAGAAVEEFKFPMIECPAERRN
jgi:thiamine biosynthesis protein ThiI